MLIWLGVGFLNGAAAETGYELYKKSKKIILVRYDLTVFTAGHLRNFLMFSIIKNDDHCILNQVNNLFLHQSSLKSPLPVKLTW